MTFVDICQNIFGHIYDFYIKGSIVSITCSTKLNDMSLKT